MAGLFLFMAKKLLRVQSKTCKCIKCVVNCFHCEGRCLLHGKTSAGNLRYRCRNCGKTRVGKYRYNACYKEIDKQIISLHKENCRIHSIARLLQIATGTVLSRILKIAQLTKKPAIVFGKGYELDEVCTYVGRKSNQQLKKTPKELLILR